MNKLKDELRRCDASAQLNFISFRLDGQLISSFVHPTISGRHIEFLSTTFTYAINFEIENGATKPDIS